MIRPARPSLAEVPLADLSLVEKTLLGPVFVLDYPAAVCPLTKRKAGAPQVAERFEFYVAGMELANAYTELNAPDLQEELFRTQLAGLPADESMARMDTSSGPSATGCRRRAASASASTGS